MTRVVIVDDDLVYRTGRAVLLTPFPYVDVKTTLDFEQALAYGDGWDDVDVALVDAYDARARWRGRDALLYGGLTIPPVDRFGGVRVVQAVRERSTAQRPTIIVVSHYKWENALLWKRMAEAGADYFYDHYEVGDPQDLVDAILRPARERSLASQPDLRALGLGPRAKVNEAVEEILSEERVAGMLTAGVPYKAVPGIQHRVRRVRARLEALLDMRLHWSRDTERRLTSPPLSQRRPIARKALGLDLPNEDDRPRGGGPGTGLT